MDSLYGGKPGAAFVIKTSFPSIDDMMEAFRQGPDYKDVWYSEHCIIDTPNKNDEDNGKIYQRGANFSDTSGGAVYIGQIVGPQSGTPYYSVKPISEIKSLLETDLDTSVYEQRAYPYLDGEEEKVWIDGTNGSIDKDLAILSLGTASQEGDEPSLVSGKEQDDIKYTWVNISKPHSDGYPTWTYVGFQIPYTVIEFTSKSVSPYDEDGIYNPVPVITENESSQGHPFWYNYNIDIPKGIKGDTLRNIRVITLSESHKEKIYNASDFRTNADGSVEAGTPSYQVSDTDIAAGRQVYVVDFLFYDKLANPTAYMVYLGDYNQVSGVEVSDSGTLTFSFTHDNNTVFSNKIKWIDTVSLDNSGKLTVHYNNDDTDYRTTISWIDNIIIDEAKGDIKVHWCDKDEDTYTTLDSKLKLITSADISSDGGIVFNTNIADQNITLNDKTTHNAFHLKYPTNIALADDTQLDADKRLQITWNWDSSGDVLQYIGDSINYIVDMHVNPSNWHLYVLFNDPTHRISLSNAQASGIGTANEVVIDGNTWVRKVKRIKGIIDASNEDSVFWLDLGAIKDQSGVLIGNNVALSDVGAGTPTTDEIVSYLNSNYPSGHKDGKIITVGNNDTSIGKSFFAFDYNTNSWYYLGAISDVSSRSAALVNPVYTSSDYSDVVSRGVVLKSSEVDYSVAPTRFWAIG